MNNQPDLLSFLNKTSDWGVKVLGDLEAYAVVWENMQDAARLGLCRTALFTLYMAMSHQLPLASVVEAVIDVQQGSRDLIFLAKLIGIMSRTLGKLTVSKNWMPYLTIVTRLPH